MNYSAEENFLFLIPFVDLKSCLLSIVIYTDNEFVFVQNNVACHWRLPVMSYEFTSCDLYDESFFSQIG